MLEPINAQAVLRSYGVTPTKKLGQNFITKPSAIDQVMAAAELGEQEQVLEIGAGLGALTLSLAKAKHKIHAIEYDPRLLPILRDMLGQYENVTIIHADILQLDLKEILQPPSYMVVANIPYQITSAVIRKLVEAPYPARRVVLTIQKEVAQRIIARPGEMSLLALSVQVFGSPSVHSHIPARAFFPQPKVESSVLRIEMFPESRVPGRDLDLFFRIAKAGFSQKRKKLRNALAAGLGITTAAVEELMQDAGISPDLRAQSLEIEQWLRLVEAVRAIS